MEAIIVRNAQRKLPIMLNINTTTNKSHLKAIIASFLIYFLSWSPLFGEGFIAGTLVKTPEGYMPIEQLHVGDKVICYDFEASCVERPVTRVIKKHVDELIALRTGGECIYLAPDHKLYLPINQQWIEARTARQGDVLLRHCTEQVLIEQVSLIPQCAEVYDITVADYHNFCVSQQDIHVHNFIIEAAVVWTIGAGVEWILGISAIGVGAKIFYDTAREKRMRSNLEFDAEEFGHRLQNTYNAQNNNNGDSGNNHGNQPPRNSRPPKDPKDPDNNKNGRKPNKPPKKSEARAADRKKNTPEDVMGFLNGAKKMYDKTKPDAWRRKPGEEGYANAEYLTRDRLHNDIEAYGRNKKHLGSIDPKTGELYKPRVPGRIFPH